MIYRDVPTRKFLPTLERVEPVSLDHSVTKAFKECPRKYFYRYVLGRKARKERSKLVFSFGNTIHKFFEVVYTTGDFDQALLAALRIHSPPGPNDTKKDELIYSNTRVLDTIKICWEFYSREQKQGSITVSAIEQPFNIMLPDGTETGGRWDQVIRTGGGDWVRDWKTTSKQVGYFATGFDPNDQATRYVYGLSRLKGWSKENPDPTAMAKGIFFTVIQNMESKASLKIETIPVTKNAQQLLAWEADQIFWYKFLSQCREADHWPMNENQCGWCDYRRVCQLGADSSKEYMLKNEFDLSPWDHNKVEQEKL